MAQAVLSHVATGGFGNILEALKVNLQRRAIYRQTVAELTALSSRDLGDLGISRSSIRQVAREAAYGK